MSKIFLWEDAPGYARALFPGKQQRARLVQVPKGVRVTPSSYVNRLERRLAATRGQFIWYAGDEARSKAVAQPSPAG